MKKFLAGILIFVIMVGVSEVGLSASETDKKTPSGISYSDIGKEIRKYMEKRQEGIAACSVSVLDGQNKIYEGYYGYSDLEDRIAVNADTVYEWGSISKLLVWVGVMQLYEEGKIDFETDISNYLPEGFLTKLEYKDKITMMNLMNHNAGWQETSYDVEVKDRGKIVSLKQALIDSEPSQIYRPGEITAYSNWGTALAAYIVERVSGMNYGKYVQDNIFAPLGIKHTSVLADCSDNPWVRAQRQKLRCYSITKDSHNAYGDCISYILLYPAGSATGTLGDLVTFAKAFTIDSVKCPFFKKADTLDTMLSASSYYGKPGAAFGLERVCHGLWTMQYATQVKGHGGNTSGCSTNLLFDDNTGLTVVVMTNEVGETAFCYGIPTLLYGSIYQRDNSAISKISDIHGIYQSMRTIKKGFLSYSSYTGNLFPIKTTDIKGKYRLSIGEGTLTQVTDRLYLFDDGNGMQSIQYLYRNEKGETYLQQYTSDYKRANPVSFWLNITILLLCCGAILFAYISFIIILMKRIFLTVMQKKKKHKQKLKVNKNMNVNIVTWLRIANLIAVMAIGVLCYQYLISPLDGGVLIKSEVMLKCILNSILSIIPVIYTVVLVLKWKNVSSYRKGHIFTSIITLIVTFNIWYWQWYNFVC